MIEPSKHPSQAYGTDCFTVGGVHFYKYRGFYLNFEKSSQEESITLYSRISTHLKYCPALLTFVNPSSLDKKKTSTWGVVAKSEPVNLATLPARARYEIKSGEKKCTVKKLTLNDSLISQIKEIFKSSYLKYGIKYSDSQLTSYVDTLNFSKRHPDLIEVWGCYSQDSLIAVAIMGVDHANRTFDLKNLKINYSLVVTGLANYFIYYLVNHYLTNFQKGFFTTGTTSISHDTKFQEFLIKKLDFYTYHTQPVLIAKNPLRLILLCCQFLLKKFTFFPSSRKIKLFLECYIY